MYYICLYTHTGHLSIICNLPATLPCPTAVELRVYVEKHGAKWPRHWIGIYGRHSFSSDLKGTWLRAGGEKKARPLLTRPLSLASLHHTAARIAPLSLRLCHPLHNSPQLCIRYYILALVKQSVSIVGTYFFPLRSLFLSCLKAPSMPPPPPFPPPSPTCCLTSWWNRKMSSSWRTSRWRWPAAPPRPHRSISSATASGFTRTTTWSSGPSTRQQVPRYI